jgi:hypothetical protein
LGAAAGSAANLLSKSPWELLGGGHGPVELPAAVPRPELPKDAAGALRVIGRAGVVRTWLRLDAAGEASTLHLDKHGIAQRCGVPLRDLRVLEPGLTTRHAPPRRARALFALLRAPRRPWAQLARRALTARLAPQLLHGAAVPRAHDGDQLGARQGALFLGVPWGARRAAHALRRRCWSPARRR